MECIHFKNNPKLRPVWIKHSVNEIVRLYQVFGVRVEGTDKICFLPNNNITDNRRKDVTYGRVVVDYLSSKHDPC